VEGPELLVPEHLVGGFFANHVDVFVDLEYVTIDFARLDPRNVREGVVVARVSAPTSCILDLKRELQGVT
jgi:hypothetical protein